MKGGTNDAITSSSSATRSSEALRRGQDAAGRPLSLGYTARLQSFERRGELESQLPQKPTGSDPRDLNAEAWEVSLKSEGLLVPEADALPAWMGMVSSPMRAPAAGGHEDPDDSDGSFELFDRAP